MCSHFLSVFVEPFWLMFIHQQAAAFVVNRKSPQTQSIALIF